MIYYFGPHNFTMMRFPLKMRDSFFVFLKNHFLKNGFGVATYFILFFKGKQNNKENSKCDS